MAALPPPSSCFACIDCCEYCEYLLRWRRGLTERFGANAHPQETEQTMVNTTLHELEVPDDEAVRQAADSLAELQAFLRGNPDSSSLVELRSDPGDDRTQLVLPQLALRLLADVLAEIANGNAVTVAPVHGELTTQQAADLINVSRPYLIKLLDERQVPYRRVGNRRKVRLDDLLAYQRRDDERRRHVLDELTREAESLGLDY